MQSQSHRERCDKEGHKEKLLEFFCLQCRKGLCSVCLIKDGAQHEGHSIRDTQDCYNEIMRDFEDNKSEMAHRSRLKHKEIKDQMEEILSRLHRLQDETNAYEQ